MKYTATAAYLSLATATLLAIVGTATSSSSASTQLLRGTQEEEISSTLAPPRVFSADHSSLLHNDDTSTIVLPRQPSLSSNPPHQRHSRTLQSRALQTNNCNTNEQSLQIILVPDKHTDSDNSFTISIRQNGKWVDLHSHSGTLPSSSFNMCLSSSGKYRFEAIDSYSDGIRNGGHYEVVLNGNTIFTTPSGDWSRSVHKFYIELNDDNGSSSNTYGGADTDRLEEIPEEEENGIVEEEEEEVEMQLLMADEEFISTSIPTSVMVMATKPTTKPTKKPTPQPTSSSGGSGGSGASTTSPPSSKPTPKPTPAAESSPSDSSQTVSTGEMTEREHQWLEEHNIRREKYHKQKGKSYAPLKWSKFLRDSAQEWAEECARTGKFDHAWHLNIGENMARHTTSGDGYRHPSNILERWVEKEINMGYPDNGHMTQCLWRATEYVGCGEAQKGNKYYQVCQYSKPGNCGVNRNDFWSSVLADDSGCKGMPLLY